MEVKSLTNTVFILIGISHNQSLSANSDILIQPDFLWSLHNKS